MDVTIRYLDAPRVFGALVVPQCKEIIARVGEAAFARAVASLSPDEREEYEALRENVWCRSATIERLVIAVAREGAVDARELTEASVHAAITGTVHTLWRALMVITDDDALLRRTPMFFARSYDRASLSGERTEPGRAELLLEGWPHVPELHAVGIAAGVRAVLELARRKDVRVEWRRDGDRAVFVVTWRP